MSAANPLTMTDLLGLIGQGGKVQLIARSPDAPVAHALLEQLPALAKRGVGFEAIFLQADAGVFARIAAACGPETARRCVRVAAMAEQGEISEQVNFGAEAVWTGRTLKETPAAFAEGVAAHAGQGSNKAKLSAMAFRALWAVSEVPAEAWKLGSEPANDSSPAPGLKVVKA